jgi:hypothetical protein
MKFNSFFLFSFLSPFSVLLSQIRVHLIWGSPYADTRRPIDAGRSPDGNATVLAHEKNCLLNLSCMLALVCAVDLIAFLFVCVFSSELRTCPTAVCWCGCKGTLTTCTALKWTRTFISSWRSWLSSHPQPPPPSPMASLTCSFPHPLMQQAVVHLFIQ